MDKIYCIIREGAAQSVNGAYKTKKDALEAAKIASSKHVNNDIYIVMESVCFARARLDFFESEM